MSQTPAAPLDGSSCRARVQPRRRVPVLNLTTSTFLAFRVAPVGTPVSRSLAMRSPARRRICMNLYKAAAAVRCSTLTSRSPSARVALRELTGHRHTLGRRGLETARRCCRNQRIVFRRRHLRGRRHSRRQTRLVLHHPRQPRGVLWRRRWLPILGLYRRVVPAVRDCERHRRRRPGPEVLEWCLRRQE